MQVNLILCNRRYDVGLPNYYIGRPGQLGNPFRPKTKSLSERDRVCDEFDNHFKNNLSYYEPYIDEMIQAAIEYGNIQLVCFCSPLRCHGDTYLEHIKNTLLRMGYDPVIKRKER